SLLSGSVELESDWRLSMMVRNILWWDGRRPDAAPPVNSLLPVGGTARLVVNIGPDLPLVLSVKAGHNDEQHNHNDIGSFLLHVAGENILTDPGRGLYSRDYFQAGRYENIFANSYGHSVPRIDGELQGTGRAFAGKLLEVPEVGVTDGSAQVALEFASAYNCPDLRSARRELRLSTEDDGAGTLWFHDTFVFAEQMHEIEEAFITWLECEVDGATAHIYGQHTVTSLKIEQAVGLNFQLERLDEQSKANQKPEVLKRLSVTFPRGKVIEAVVRITVHEKKPFPEIARQG
ncbi:MAG TPA: heparinase II/III family protein, partial [Ktedonobacteraceae bacterium]